MYIKHMKLICSDLKQKTSGLVSLQNGPLQVLGSKETLFAYLYRYQWPLGLSDHQSLFQMFQNMKLLTHEGTSSPCKSCPKRVICLVTSHQDRDYSWPREVCPLIKAEKHTIRDNQLTGEKLTHNKTRFVMDRKCNACALKACCTHYTLVLRILCNHFTEKESLVVMARENILKVWPSVEELMRALTLGWRFLNFRPPGGKRKRRFRIAYIHPNQEVDLIQDYYPYQLLKRSVPLDQLGLQLPEEENLIISDDGLVTTYIFWRLLNEHVRQNRQHSYYRGLGSLRILGHTNYLLSLYRNIEGHPVLVTANSRWSYETTFQTFDSIGWKMEWSPLSVLSYFRGNPADRNIY
ncbi:hypothetical protein BVY01_00175 [bacterium I07]|nr:hypothetical protein BVY01_00175 [bacterium I07]